MAGVIIGDTSSVLQWDLIGKFNITNLLSKKTIGTRKFDIYGSAGFGLSAFRTSLRALVNGVSTDPVIDTQGYDYARYIGEIIK